MNYDFPETTKWMYGHILTLNHEQKLNSVWTMFFNGGFSRRDGNKFNSGANLIFDAAGKFTTANKANAQNESAKNSYLQIGLKMKAATGLVKHDVAVSVDRAWARYWNDSNNGTGGLYGGDLYSGIVFKSGFYPLPSLRPAAAQWEETNVGVTLADSMSYGKVNLLLAASRKHEHFENLVSPSVIRNDNTLPTYGLTYRPTDQVSVYYGHTECFSRGGVVSNDIKYVNAGETLAPVTSKQNEIGIKYMNAGILSTVSLFQIDEPNLIDAWAGANLYRRTADGKNRYQGMELTANGKVASKWTMTGGFLYLDAERVHTKNGAKDGSFVPGVAQWSGVVGLEYQANQDCSLIGRLVWCDRSFIENTSSNGKIELPAYATLDMGIKYNTHINTVPVRLSLMCYNALNKSYWMGRGGSSTFGLSMPRTWMVSAQFDF